VTVNIDAIVGEVTREPSLGFELLPISFHQDRAKDGGSRADATEGRKERSDGWVMDGPRLQKILLSASDFAVSSCGLQDGRYLGFVRDTPAGTFREDWATS
jgi:hypothetical protein